MAGEVMGAGVVWGSRAEVEAGAGSGEPAAGGLEAALRRCGAAALRRCGAAALRRTALAVECVVHLGAWHGEHL